MLLGTWSGWEETPPRAWGRPSPEVAAATEARNTPTCVGKTRQPTLNAKLLEKHPHVRGEDKAPSWRRVAKMETPPRAWGRPDLQRKHGAVRRNTPTCVGKTRRVRRHIERAGKHPHVRGEDHRAGRPLMTAMETPPRAWGRHVIEPETWAKVGNTPTCVGKTPDNPGPARCRRKHPHVRGEDLATVLTNDIECETPPRAWGRRVGPVTDDGPDRNTPTCVGKTVRGQVVHYAW